MEIKKGIPIPPMSSGRKSKYPEHKCVLKVFKVGDSVEFVMDAKRNDCEGLYSNVAQNFIRTGTQKFGYKMVSRKISEDTIMVWRIE